MQPDDRQFPGRDQPITLVAAADEGYALPLAVSIRSAIDRLGPGARVQVFVIDGGITPASRKRLTDSWRDERCTVEWRTLETPRLAEFAISDHVTRTTYARLLLDEMLPSDLGRAIYIDADVLVRRDLGLLWNEPFGGATALAVTDVAAPRIDAEIGLSNFSRCGPLLAAARPVANYRELGLAADAPYLNAGLLVIDLDRWRREQIGPRCLDALRRHREHVLWWDQYALNVVLAGQWRPLDPRWNQGAAVYNYPSWDASPFDQATFDAVRNDPWIVHFCSPRKPWHLFCDHPRSPEFVAAVGRTAWTGWRPTPRETWLADWWQHRGEPVRDRIRSQVRAWRQTVKRVLLAA